VNLAPAQAVSAFGRLTHHHPDLDHDEYMGDRHSKLVPLPLDESNVVSSLLTNGGHAPAIDVDLPIHAVQSSTPGHWHLYLDVELSWPDYLRLLEVMRDVGIVQDGFYRSAKSRGTTLLRLPGVPKPDEPCLCERCTPEGSA
jgi:hypothetical protein